MFFCSFLSTWNINKCYKIWCFIGLYTVAGAFFIPSNFVSIQNEQRNQYKVRCKYFIVYEHIFRKRNNNNNNKKTISTGLHTSSTIRRSSTYWYFNMHLKEIASCVLTLWVGILMTISAWRSTVVASTINRKAHLFFEKYKLFSRILNDIFVFFYRNIPNFMHIL